MLILLKTINIIILLAFNPYKGPNRRIKESLQALRDKHVEERAIIRVYILGPAALMTSS